MALKDPVLVDEKVTNSFSEAARETGTESLDLLPVGRKLKIKIDLRLIPILGLTYAIIFLDRTNIANARIEGLEKGLNFPPTGFNTALWIFYIPFVLIEVPSNIIMSIQSVKPNLYLGAMVIILGLISTCQGLAKSYNGFLAIRFFMGIFEATLPAGSTFLVASYYTREDGASRLAMFFFFAPLGPAFGGLLAYAIRNMDGINGLAGWRWIFIIEGIITIAIGFLVVLLVPDFPEKATFITPDERDRLVAKLRADKGPEKLDLKNIPWLKILIDYRIWFPTCIFFCIDMTAASMASFIPTILAELGWTASKAQVMSIPIWLFGVVVQLVGSYIAGKTNLRFPFMLGGIGLCIIGWAIQEAYVKAASVRYMALYFLSGGVFIQFTMLFSWVSCNLRGRAVTAIGMAILFGLGNCANFVAANVFITKERPRYPTGFKAGLAMSVIGFGLTLVYAGILQIHNKKLDAKRKQTENWEDTQEEYRYVL